MKIEIAIKGLKINEAARIRRFSSGVFKKLAAERALSFFKKKKVISFSLLVSDRESRRLNSKYRKKHRATNVLSFPLYPTTQALKNDASRLIELGDIVISPKAVSKEAKIAHTDYYSQFCWMTLHGILHVIGLDHERGRAERRLMERLEMKILSGR